VEAGAPGAGGFVSWRFFDHLGVRGGFDYFQWTEDDLHIANLHYDTKLTMMSEPLTLDIYPWKNHSFHLSAGVLFNQNKLTGTTTGIFPITIGGVTFPGTDVGTLNLKIQQQPVNPYVSIGGNFFYFDHAHHWAMGGELGAFYTGDYKVSLTRSGGAANGAIDAAVNREQQNAHDWANQLKWFPVLKLNVTYSF
jgi:hypothetical protein